MIPRLKRQTKKRHSVIAGRKLFKRNVTRMIADVMARKIVERVTALLAEGAL